VDFWIGGFLSIGLLSLDRKLRELCGEGRAVRNGATVKIQPFFSIDRQVRVIANLLIPRFLKI